MKFRKFFRLRELLIKLEKRRSNEDLTRSDTERATIGNYAQMQGPTAALRHFKIQYLDLKYTTVCEWKKAIDAEQKKNPTTCNGTEKQEERKAINASQ